MKRLSPEMTTLRQTVRILFALLCGALILQGCGPGAKEWQPSVTVVGEAPPLVWTVATAPPGSQENHLYCFLCPEGRVVFSDLDANVLACWGTGLLLKKAGAVEWRDLDSSAGVYNPDPDIDLTSWDSPLAVDPTERTIYAFGNSVPPSRKIMTHFLDGREPVLANELVADDYEPLTPLPANGWPVFYVDRPSQARNITPEPQPTRKLRIYAGSTVAGEQRDVISVHLIRDSVAVRTKNEWLLFELSDFRRVSNRTMSLGQIPGELKPLDRIDDTALIVSNQVDDKGNVTASSLYTYGVYTRMVEKVWDASVDGSPGEILEVYALSGTDFLLVLAGLQKSKHLTLGRLRNGVWETLAVMDAASDVVRTDVVPLSTPVPEEPQESATQTESAVEPEEDG